MKAKDGTFLTPRARMFYDTFYTAENVFSLSGSPESEETGSAVGSKTTTTINRYETTRLIVVVVTLLRVRIQSIRCICNNNSGGNLIVVTRIIT